MDVSGCKEIMLIKTNTLIGIHSSQLDWDTLVPGSFPRLINRSPS